jgi:hypothetical protein
MNNAEGITFAVTQNILTVLVGLHAITVGMWLWISILSKRGVVTFPVLRVITAYISAQGMFSLVSYLLTKQTYRTPNNGMSLILIVVMNLGVSAWCLWKIKMLNRHFTKHQKKGAITAGIQDVINAEAEKGLTEEQNILLQTIWLAVRDPLSRGVRVFFMAWAGVFLFFISPEVLQFTDANYVPDLNVWKRGAVAGMAAGMVALVSFLMNLAEDKTTTPILSPLRALKNVQRETPPAPNIGANEVKVEPDGNTH